MVRSTDKNIYRHASEHFDSDKNWKETKPNYKRMTCHSHVHERMERNSAMSLNSKKQNRDRNPEPLCWTPFVIDWILEISCYSARSTSALFRLFGIRKLLSDP